MPDKKGSSRSAKLRALFGGILSGKQNITGSNPILFLEAICDHPEPAICIQRLVSSSHGYPALQSSFLFDPSPAFFNGPLAAFFCYLQAPELRTICAGEVLRQVTLKFAETPLAWGRFIEAARCGNLTEQGIEAFSWLLLQLVSLPTERAIEYAALGQDEKIRKQLLECSQLQVRLRAQRIVHITRTITAKRTVDVGGPGGRHDNDFSDIRKIAILPSPDELVSKNPYLPRPNEMDEVRHKPEWLSFHIDCQFRLLREDMLRDIREEIQMVITGKRGRRKGLSVENLSMAGVRCGNRQPWALQLRCLQDLPQLHGKDIAEQKVFLQENKKFLTHESAACLLADDDIITLGTLIRDEDLLINKPPIICLQIPDLVVEKTLLRIKTAKNVRLIQLSTAIFAYEPVLKQLKEIQELSLGEDILRWERGRTLAHPSYELSSDMVDAMANLDKDHAIDLRHVLRLSSPTKLDKSQAKCFLAGLRQTVSLIQGPPGTGKSFIGSLLAKAIYNHSKEKILVVCYTHHALDQFLEDLLNLGIPSHEIVRLGSPKKATMRTQALSIKQVGSGAKLSHYQRLMLDLSNQEISEARDSLQNAFLSFQHSNFSKSDILEHLEFKVDSPSFFAALKVPDKSNGMRRVGKKGRVADEFHLLDRWCRGKDAGAFERERGQPFQCVWSMRSQDRLDALNEWKNEMLKERLASVRDSGIAHNKPLWQMQAINMEKELTVMRQKRVIACTTTAAAKNVRALRSIEPGILLVEEAGEILESHILTALSPYTKQLILIGDHKQLRPKVHYDLSVEKGDGYDLNRSLFERLVLQGYPHQVLSQQHRMRPELSALVRELTYPDLTDAATTQKRPNLRGFQSNLIFVNHKNHELEMLDVPDWKDRTSTSSKQNLFEAKMTLKCVRYLGQQGYRTDSIVVLTPYLGQLHLLLDELGKDNDPVLNDLDCHDLVRAGLMPAASASLGKPKITVSTIDNFQGDERDVVIVSLTRSNHRRDIGFMSSPERLNVLLSRARDALILIGDAETFVGSRKGGDLWQRLMEMLKVGNCIYDGFPVRCDRHPDRIAILQCPEDFDRECPDGGCKDLCDTMLRCGLHRCPQHCHKLHDHSNILCQSVVEFKCPKNHVQKRKCHKSQPAMCGQCEIGNERRQNQLEADLERQIRREKARAKYDKEMVKLDRELRKEREEAIDSTTDAERARALEQKRRDLEVAKQNAQTAQLHNKIGSYTASGPMANPKVASAKASKKELSQSVRGWQAGPLNALAPEGSAKTQSEMEWARQKRVDNASNDAIETLMGLTGLEGVKAKVLSIKAKIETVSRQGANIKKERLGIVMLGNPGTGKTTVARLYAQFLASVNALPGKEFVETSGSSLANEGVAGAKMKIEQITNAGGGAFFLDEAYQLASSDNYGGKAVLNYLLAEIEEKVGKVVFILAGYSKDMEKFFEHNPGFDSRMPHRLTFADFTDKDLMVMLGRMIDGKYAGRAKIEDGSQGLYTRILIKRLGKGRGTEGYGNARSLENAWAKVAERQASRLHQERVSGTMPDDFYFKKEDLIGPEPVGAIQQSAAWEELQNLIGLTAVKDSVTGFVNRIQLNYQRELNEKPPIEVSLNRIFLGSPGTGKTTVGKLYASILADLGLLSKSEVVCKTPADFVGSVLGESENNTKAILKSTEGKVLLIDEAYGLYPGGKGGTILDPYKSAVIDTIVAGVQSTPGEDRCVLLLGYKDQMTEMLDNSNPGLARRFPVGFAFHFEDFTDGELRQILELKLRKQGLEATDEAKHTAIDLLSKLRDRPNFGNAGEVENLISHAKESEQKRSSSMGSGARDADIVFLPQDFDKDFDRATNSADIFQKLFADIVGCEGLVGKLERYQRIAASTRARGRDPREHVPFNFIFKGPPGTGKTTIARKMGELFYSMGILSTSDYLELSASDLIAQYMGQSAPKTRQVLKRGLGKVLFIDEAYRLCDGDFGREAVNEMVDSLTKPQFMRKVVVILAGYNEEINRLLRVNPGLSSRFPEEVTFENMSPQQSLALLIRQLKNDGTEIANDFQDTASESYLKVIDTLKQLSGLSFWGNGRDIKTLSKSLTAAALERTEDYSSPLIVGIEDTARALDEMFRSQKARSGERSVLDARREAGSRTQSRDSVASPPVPFSTTPPAVADKKIDKKRQPAELSPRDPEVSDEIWNQLQADITSNAAVSTSNSEAVAATEQNAQEMRAEEEESCQGLDTLEKAAMKTAQDAKQGKLNELKRKQEDERLRNPAIERAREEAEEVLRKAQEEQWKQREEEAKSQKKLSDISVCPAGFR